MLRKLFSLSVSTSVTSQRKAAEVATGIISSLTCSPALNTGLLGIWFDILATLFSRMEAILKAPGSVSIFKSCCQITNSPPSHSGHLAFSCPLIDMGNAGDEVSTWSMDDTPATSVFGLLPGAPVEHKSMRNFSLEDTVHHKVPKAHRGKENGTT